MIVLDTNVVSALMRPDANDQAVRWADTLPRSLFWLTTISLTEIRGGLIFMPAGKRRDRLEQGFASLLSTLFEHRVLAFDAQAAEHAALVDFIQNKSGRDIGIGDMQIAGICRARGATLATRNVKHFADLDIPLINPWEA